MSTTAKRQDAGAAVAGLFDGPTATGGLAGRDRSPDPAGPPDNHARLSPVTASATVVAAGEPRVRLGVELTEREIAFLRGLSRPTETGQPRTLGGKFVATGVLAAAIELLAGVEVEMHGVHAGSEMTARARAALLRAGTTQDARKEQP